MKYFIGTSIFVIIASIIILNFYWNHYPVHSSLLTVLSDIKISDNELPVINIIKFVIINKVYLLSLSSYEFMEFHRYSLINFIIFNVIIIVISDTIKYCYNWSNVFIIIER